MHMVLRKRTLLLLLLALSGLSCSTPSVNYKQSDIESNQKQWLSKAYRYDQNGWIFLHIEGKPFERGFQRGYLTANEINEFYKTMSHTQEFETGENIDFFVKASSKLFKNKVSHEYVEEMQGMAAGCEAAGKNITYDQMLFMNGFIDVAWYWWPTVKNKLPDGLDAVPLLRRGTRQHMAKS